MDRSIDARAIRCTIESRNTYRLNGKAGEGEVGKEGDELHCDESMSRLFNQIVVVVVSATKGTC